MSSLPVLPPDLIPVEQQASRWAVFKGPLSGVMMLGLIALAGAFFNPASERIYRKTAPDSSLTPALGKRLSTESFAGLSIALLGGFKTVVADAAFLKGYLKWERKAIIETRLQMELALALAPDVLEFWIRYAHMVAFDFPHFEQRALQKRGLPATEQDFQSARLRHFREALRILDRAQLQHPNSGRLYYERARLSLSVTQLPSQSLHDLAVAVSLPDCPWHGFRLYGQLLEAAERLPEAVAFYKAILPMHPTDLELPEAQRSYLEYRISELEDALLEP